MQQFVFAITSFDKTAALPQLSRALEKYTEQTSRRSHPELWKHIDRRGGTPQPFAPMTRGQRIRTRVLGSICLILGVILFVPGVLKSGELLVPLLMGAVGIGAGIGAFYRSRKNRKNPFDRSAELYLRERTELPVGQTAAFDADGMTLSENGEVVQKAPFESVECAVETDDLFVLFWGGQVVALQKKDLSGGTPDDFREFLAASVGLHNA